MNRVRELRIKAQMSQKELAVAIGVAQPTVSEWENQRKDPSKEKLRLLCNLFGCSAKDIMVPDYLNPVQTALINAEPWTPPSDVDPNTIYMQERIRRSADMQTLFDAADNSSPEQIQAAAELLKNPSGAHPADGPRTIEARIVSGGMDKLPEEQRQQILNVVRAMFSQHPELFE